MAAGGEGTIAVATSIPPVQTRQDGGRVAPDYQALCIRSWIANGFRVISVNHTDEVPALAERYPDVTFVPTSRDARQWTGRKNPYIADLLLALADAREPVLGLINSDLLFEPSTAWAENLPSRITGSMVVAHRYNTHALRDAALRRFQGLDCFFFDRPTAVCVLENALPFAIGAPWWDYWLPCIALLNGRAIAVVDRPAILHLFHKTAYSGDSQREFGRHFANALIHESQKSNACHAPAFAAVQPMLLEIAASSLDGDALKRKFAQLCETFIGEIRKGAEVWEASPPAVAPAGVQDAFERFDQRLSAGDAFRQARHLLAQRPPVEAGPDLVAALQQAPMDPDVLSILGEISLRRGASEAASNYFAEAAGFFWETGRPTDAIGFLDNILARHPHLMRIADLRDAYRRLTNT